jgi:hypothetical protein
MPRATLPYFYLALIAFLPFFLGGWPLSDARGDYVTGLDAGAGPGDPASRPNSTAADARFTSLTSGPSSQTLIDFEGLPAGQPADGKSFAVDRSGQVTASTLNTDHPSTLPPGYQFGVTNSPGTDPLNNNADQGFSISGTQYFRFVPSLYGGPAGGTGISSFTLSSATPFTSFGFYLTGLGNVQDSESLHLIFTTAGGTPQDTVIQGAPSGGVLFMGYVGTGAPISSFTLAMEGVTSANRDVIGIDDVRLVPAVPEPSALVLSVTGFLAWFAARRLRPGSGRRGD